MSDESTPAQQQLAPTQAKRYGGFVPQQVCFSSWQSHPRSHVFVLCPAFLIHC